MNAAKSLSLLDRMFAVIGCVFASEYVLLFQVVGNWLYSDDKALERHSIEVVMRSCGV